MTRSLLWMFFRHIHMSEDNAVGLDRVTVDMNEWSGAVVDVVRA